MQTVILKLFNCILLDSGQIVSDVNTDYIDYGFVCNFNPTTEQLFDLQEAHKPLDIKTLFSMEERETGSLAYLLTKQFLHYIEVYGLNSPGLFDLECTNGQVVKLRYVQGITRDELSDKLLSLLYSNAPIADAPELVKLVKDLYVDFDLNSVKNNEARILLYSPNHKFSSGDDAVRYLVYKATESTLLIKSPEVITKLGDLKNNIWVARFLEDHAIPLAGVWNRHKRLLLALKSGTTKTSINRISRFSKTHHIPIKEHISKTFISKALSGIAGPAELEQCSIRDKFKFLNFIQAKFAGIPSNVYKIRNGKVWLKANKTSSDVTLKYVRIQNMILESLKRELGSKLKNKSIKLDPCVDYGLPISRKQTLGRLPFGTKITSQKETISSGIYWDVTDTDLDLSGIDTSFTRVGWGNYSGYVDRELIYSGDVTSGANGAMEFITSKCNINRPYGIFLNVYRGSKPCPASLVLGSKAEDRWIEDIIIKEEFELLSNATFLGFVKNDTFTIAPFRLSSNNISGGSRDGELMKSAIATVWTVKSLLETLGIAYQYTDEADIDLTYSSFSYDKLERLFYD